MAHRVKTFGYVVRQALSEPEQSDVELARVFDDLLTCESAGLRDRLIAKGAVNVTKRAEALRILRTALIEENRV